MKPKNIFKINDAQAGRFASPPPPSASGSSNVIDCAGFSKAENRLEAEVPADITKSDSIDGSHNFFDPREDQNESLPTTTLKTAEITKKEKGDAHSPKDTSDKIASCEDNGAPKAPDVGKSATAPVTKKAITPSPAVQAAIDRCLAIRNTPGSFIGWGERSEATAAAALTLVVLMENDHSALTHVRKVCNEERKRRGERSLNASTSDELLAVFMCAPPKTKADRQECSRFANVISVAVAEKRTPENVGAWLKATTLSDVLEKAQTIKGKRSNKTYSVAITPSNYPQLWARFRTEEVRTAIAKALKSVDNSLKKAASNAR